RLTNEEAFALQHLFREAGVANLDWRGGRQRQATPGAFGAALDRIDDAQAIVIAGESPEERAPVLWLRIRKAALRNGAKIVTAKSANEARDTAGGASRVALIWDGADPAQAREYAQAFAGNGELTTYIASEQANARGAEAMGMLPFSGPGYAAADPGLDAYAMFDAARAGQLAVLSIFGVNPARNAADPRAAADALDRLPFLVVSDLFMTETAQRATLVLPAKGAFEKHGTTLNLAGDLLPVNASLTAPDSVRSDYEMLAGLAEQLGVSIPSDDQLHRLVVKFAASDPDFVLGDARFGAVTMASLSRPILSGGGTWQHDPRLAGMRT
ncbi:MAG TPA: molybdopterin-dependent oxidoreductase, partial [Candidatus Nitrosotalea sp.]|nr:molybdopterin-dependent oxidoreductase [Candidatus Nitrosotalea sp.]